ncbi:MAG: ribbon-helix-helix protein, CopG family [Candidatus Micrarchaeota archaeon]|nr:ribbon-helix-helix protein, CopG family [Candidatus Micrarchaeota archaeon]
MARMEIISISLDSETLKRVNEIQERLGFKSRSKMLRSAMQSLINDYGGMGSLGGEVESVFVVTYKENERNHVSDILHRFKDVVETEMHHHHAGKGIDVLNLDTSAARTKELFNELKRSKCVSSVTCSVISERKR